MRQRAAQAGGDNRREGWPLRALCTHEVLHMRRHLELRDAGAQEGNDILIRRIGNLARLANLGNLTSVLDLAQIIEVQRDSDLPSRQALCKLLVLQIRQVVSLEADLFRIYRVQDLRSAQQQSVLLLDEFIERRLLLRLLRITIIRDEYQPLRRNDKCRIVSAKATEIEKVDFLRHDNGIEPPLSE